MKEKLKNKRGKIMKKIVKWFGRIFIVIVVLVCSIVGYAMFTAARTENPVGFQIIQTTDADGHPFTVAYGIQLKPSLSRRRC